MVCVCGAKAKGKLYWEVYNFQQAIKNTTSSPKLPLLAMLFLLRLKDLWKGERDKYNSHHKYPYAAGRLAGRQLFQLIYTHVCVCVRVCVWQAGNWLRQDVRNGYAKWQLCCPYAAAGRQGAKANKLDKCILCIQGTPVTHTHPAPPLLLVFYDTLLCACGRASYKNSCTFCLYASRMLLLPPV